MKGGWQGSQVNFRSAALTALSARSTYAFSGKPRRLSDKLTDKNVLNTRKVVLYMANHPIESMMDTTMEKIRQMVDVNTIIGEPVICPDGTVIIPVSKVSYGFAAGGSDLPTKTQKDLFGGGSGAGVSIQPVAFLVVNDGNVKMLNMEYDGAADRIVGLVPEVFDKIGELFKKNKKDKKGNSDESPAAEASNSNGNEAADVGEAIF